MITPPYVIESKQAKRSYNISRFFKKTILTIVGLAVGILGIWAFLVLDMPARLVFQDRGLSGIRPAFGPNAP